MTGWRDSMCFALGLPAAALTLWLAAAGSALAQSRADTVFTTRNAEAGAVGPRVEPALSAAASLEDLSWAPDPWAAEVEGSPEPVARDAVPDADPEEAEDGPSPQGGGEFGRDTPLLLVGEDGRWGSRTEVRISPTPDLSPQGGGEHATESVYERAGALPDPRALAIDPDPLRYRRPERLFRFEPFQPVGVRVGSFLLFPEVDSAFAASSNIFRSNTDPRSDVALEIRPSARLVSNWSVHALELRATGLASFHDHFASEDDRAWALEARGRLDVTRRTNLEALASSQLEQEARGSLEAPTAAASRADISTQKVFLAANHSFNRLSVQLRGGITDVNYGSVTTKDGEIISNDERDVLQKDAVARAMWEFKPTLLVFAEAGGNAREHNAAPSDGIKRDSTGERWRLGLSFGTSGQILRGEAGLGYGTQRPDDRRLAAVDGVLIDANLAWRVTELTTVLLLAQTDFPDSTVSGTAASLARTAGLELRHAFRRDLIATAGLAYAQQDYDTAHIRERELRPSLGIEYFLSREAVLFGRYQHIAFDSTEPGRDYVSDEFRVGVRLRR